DLQRLTPDRIAHLPRGFGAEDREEPVHQPDHQLYLYDEHGQREQQAEQPPGDAEDDLEGDPGDQADGGDGCDSANHLRFSCVPVRAPNAEISPSTSTPGDPPRRGRTTSPMARAGAPALASVARVFGARIAESRCPSRPNPVTSVSACTDFQFRAYTSPAARLSSFICAVAASTSPGSAVPFLIAEMAIPVPSALPSSSTSPGFAPAFVSTRFGSTRPVTANPYFGSRSSTLCPPTMAQSASRAAWAPPARISPSSSNGCERGHPTTFSA